MDEGDLAWLGFKVVYDGAAAQGNVDNEVTKKYGEQGSADGEPLVFFCNDAKEIVASRELSPRDIFQAKDVTRGPSMHNDQSTASPGERAALREGAGVAARCVRCGRRSGSAGRSCGLPCGGRRLRPGVFERGTFPDCRAHHAAWGNFDELANMPGRPEDYVCVLTRGHMFDPEAASGAAERRALCGMMGCAGKNSTVHDLVVGAGITETDWDRVKRPIGLSFGAKTPAELAIAIVGELVDVRYRQRYSEEAQARHEKSLGRE